MSSTNVTADERKVYDTVLEKLDGFFKVRRNVIFERARFNRRNQLGTESAEQYIMELYRLAESCNYGDFKDEMIRDRLVVGIRDAALSQQLQLDPELTLEKAKKKIRQREAVGEQQRELKGAAEGVTSPGERDRTRTNRDVTAKRNLLPLRRALAVARVGMPATDAPQKRRPTIGATRKGTTALSASPSKSLQSQVRACLTQPSWTWSLQNRAQHGSPP